MIIKTKFEGYTAGIRLYPKDSGSPPTPPNPYQTADAQTRANMSTANFNAGLNRVNMNTPWGSLTYSHAPAPGTTQQPTAPTFDQAGYDRAMQQWQSASAPNPVTGESNSGTPMPTRDQFTTGGAGGGIGGNVQPDQWSANIALSPEQQRLLDLSNANSIGMGQIASNLRGAVTDQLSNPMNFNGAPAQVTHVDAGPTRDSASYGSIQNDVDTSGVPRLIGGDALAGDLNTQRDALYRQQAAYLDPQWANRDHDLENQLTQQGIMRNSEAWNRAMEEQGRQRSFDYGQARNAAITGGGAEQSRLFGIGLASNQNAYNQALNNAQFHNAAQAQGFGQDMANAQLQNMVQALRFGQGMQNANLQNQGRQQSISETQALRDQPINEMAALRQGSQVTAPNFPSVPGANMAGTDIAGLIGQNFANQMGGYNAGVAQNNAMMGGLFNLGAAAIPFLL